MQAESKKLKHDQLSVYYKALAHPARLAIVEKLTVAGACTCIEFVRELPLAQATISEHLRKLKLAGLITVTEKGNTSVYSLNKQGMKQFKRTQLALNV